ncbi:MAG: hypothetical protein ABI743_00255 [bacterium]
MRYMVILVVTFAVYFWAVANIGDKYVKKYDVQLPAEPSKGLVDLYEGRIQPGDVAKGKDGEGPTQRVVEY